MIEYLGDIGGLIQIIMIVGTFFVGFIIERQFLAAMVRDTFQIQRYFDDQSEYYKTLQGNSQKHIKNRLELTPESLSSDN